MKSFLKIIAEGYQRHYFDFSSITFVMPNNRSEAFLMKEISLLSDTPVLAPRVLPIKDFIGTVAEKVVDSRIDSIFRLYRIFNEFKNDSEKISFEKFCPLGETILSDFSEIDMQMANPDEIFKNVYDLNAIRSNFLSPAHKKVLENYFGYTAEELDSETSRNLWVKFESFAEDLGGGNSDLKKRFRSVWALLGPLYRLFKESLEADGLTTQGGAYRAVAEKIEAGFEPFSGEKIVFVGFNALSESENRIFRLLKKMKVDIGLGEEPKADFIWDKVYPFFGSETDDPSSHFIAVNSADDRFPMPEWIRKDMEDSYGERKPDVKVVSVPSNVMQAKIAGLELEDWEGELSEEKIREAGIAIILPDENMLMPLLYSLPSKFSHPNLTMGFPLKQTPVAGFASLLRRIHQGAMKGALKDAFFFNDVKDFLCHPYSHILFSESDTKEFIQKYELKRRLVVSTKTLEHLGECADLIFKNFNVQTSPSVVLEYILSIFKEIMKRLDCDDNKTYIRSKVERVYISTYIDAVITLSHCISEYQLGLTPEDIFMLADRLIAGENVVFKGKPLEGLQVMGVLETRCLDFERLIILSMNEKIMPRVGRNSTFIPNVVRMAFGMPPANYQQEIFAYYFFRLLNRCEKVLLTYDSRSTDNRNPGISRYILQMKYLAPEITVREAEARFDLPSALTQKIDVEKNEELLAALECFDPQSDSAEISGVRNFSASALKDYFSCPLKFLYKDVLQLYTEQEELETINAADLGTIVHKSIERLYFPEGKRGRFLEEPILIDRLRLDSLLNEVNEHGETRIERAARRSILETHFGLREEESAAGVLRGSSVILLEFIADYIKKIIRADKKIAPFRLWGSEIKRTLRYRLPHGKEVQFKMVIDRLDQEGASDTNAPFRVVDYKTGGAHLFANSYAEVFDGTLAASNIFQLIFYAELLILSVRRNLIPLPENIDRNEFERKLKMVIYEITKLDIQGNNKGVVSPIIGKYINEKGSEAFRKIEDMGDFRQFETDCQQCFMKDIEQLLEEILNPDLPFNGIPDEDNCRFCDYRLRCRIMRARKEHQEEEGIDKEIKPT